MSCSSTVQKSSITMTSVQYKSWELMPEPLLTDILLRLPLKEILRLTCLCKQWYKLITDSEFASEHLRLVIKKMSMEEHDQRLLLIKSFDLLEGKEQYKLHQNNENLYEHVEIQVPFHPSSRNKYFRVAGSCNGLLCLTDNWHSYTDNVILWNPSIGKLMQLPPSQISYQGNGICVYGMGFDAALDDPKVVRIIMSFDSIEENDMRSTFTEKVIQKHIRAKCSAATYEVYTHSTRVWDRIKDFKLPCTLHDGLSSPYINGAVHWGGFGSDDKIHCVVAFNIGTETFSRMELPSNVASKTVTGFSILKIGENLALVEYDRVFDCESCCIWVMEKYSCSSDAWIKLYDIDMRGRLRRVVGFKSNGEVFIAAIGNLYTYHPY